LDVAGLFPACGIKEGLLLLSFYVAYIFYLVLGAA